jgi:predicted SAM-dependent methyltransferase
LLLRGRKDLKLNLGCGALPKHSWVNIDIYIPDSAKKVLATHPDTVLINHNLCKSLPLDDESCSYIYSSHFFEHLEWKKGIKLMTRCFEKLNPGGVFRIALPNFRLVFQAYLSGDCSMWDIVDQYVDEMMPGIKKTALDYLNFAVYQDGEHKCIYDEERIVIILKKIGFSSVALSSYSKSIDEDLDTHRKYSFYVEAVK